MTRLSKITTRTGDKGQTGLGDGRRVPKDAARLSAMGDVDELNSAVGLWCTETLPPDIQALLVEIQNDLFNVGAQLCIPGHQVMTAEHVHMLDQAVQRYNAELGDLKEFILPGGTRAAALAHMARTICRRAERSVVGMYRAEAHEVQSNPAKPGTAAADDLDLPGDDFVLQYLNRLSDLCFVLARALNREAARPDVLWRRQ